MLKRFNFKPSTRYTFFKDLEWSLPILPIPTILRTLLSPKVTLPCLSFLISLKKDAFPAMCLEQPLSRGQSSSLAFKHTCKMLNQTFLALTLNFGSNVGWGHILWFCSFWYPNLNDFRFGFLRGHEWDTWPFLEQWLHTMWELFLNASWTKKFLYVFFF